MEFYLTANPARQTGWDEGNLIQTAQQGDLEAFNQLVVLYQDRIYHLALRILGDEDSAEDVTQEVFLIAYRKLDRFRNGSFRGWLYRIATNGCYDELRRRKSRPVQPLEYEDEVQTGVLQAADWHGSRNLPEKEHERREMERAIQRALNRLGADQRAAVVLVDLQGFDYLEAAQACGVPVGTLKSRLARGRLQLQKLLRPVIDSVE